MIKVKYVDAVCTLVRYWWTSDDSWSENSLNRLTALYPPDPLDPDPERTIFNTLNGMECFREVLVFEPTYLGTDIDPNAFPNHPDPKMSPYGDDVYPAHKDQESVEYGVTDDAGDKSPSSKGNDRSWYEV